MIGLGEAIANVWRDRVGITLFPQQLRHTKP